MNARGSLRGLRRVEPLLKGVEQYAAVLGVRCDGTPYLPWLWVGVYHAATWINMIMTDWTHAGTCEIIDPGELSTLVCLPTCHIPPDAPI